MASWDECIDAALSQGKISKAVADAVRASDSPIDTVNAMTANAKRQRREAAIQAVRIADAWENLSAHPEGKETGLMSLMVKDVTGKSGYANVDMRASYYEGRYHSMFRDALSRFRTTKLGWAQDEEGLNKLVRALYGEAVDDSEVMGFAADYVSLRAQMREDFNRLGGSISDNERWIAPQNHDARTILKYGKEEWLADIEKWADREHMTDDAGTKLSPEDMTAGLDYAYESITTHGLNKAKDFTAPVGQGKKMARRGSEKRFIYFKDAESWLAYQNKYGRGDIFQTLVSDINNVSSDIANMEIFGTNPRGAFDALKAQVEKAKPIGGANKNMLEAVFKTTSGEIDRGNLVGLTDFMQNVRNVITASKLGKAIISAISDEGFTAITAGYNNLPVSKILATKVKLASGTKAAKELNLAAVRIGLGAETWTKVASSANRYGDVYGTGKTAKIAETVMRGSGLEPWTEAGRKAFTLEFAGYIAENFGKTFSELPQKTLRGFESYGITEDIWNQFRKSKPFNHQGALYADMLQPGGDKFHQMLMSEVDYAVPTPDARVRAITTGGLGTGTVSGQMMRSITNLKSFPITLVTTHFYRIAYQATNGERASYAGMMLASTSLLGLLAIQAKDMTAGREPRPLMNKDGSINTALMGAAIMQSGGLGIFGDYLFSDQNRFGGGMSATLFGPTGQLLDDTVKLSVGNLQQAFRGEDTNFSTEFIRYMESNTPSVWQIQPVKNAMFDQLELLVDPKSQKRMNQARRKRKKEYGQDYWWKPGEALPEFAN